VTQSGGQLRLNSGSRGMSDETTRLHRIV
jgi:hypothetical protein